MSDLIDLEKVREERELELDRISTIRDYMIMFQEGLMAFDLKKYGVTKFREELTKEIVRLSNLISKD